MSSIDTDPDSTMMWAPTSVEVINGLHNEPVVVFADWFVESVKDWQARFGDTMLGVWQCRDDLIIINQGDLHRVWRFTGETDDRGGLIAAWPD